MLFWPAGYTRSFGFFCCAQFISACGTGLFSAQAFGYLAVCGPTKWAELRNPLIGSFTTVCTIGGQVLASYCILDDSNMANLAPLQWFGLAIGCTSITIAMLFALVPIPEITNADIVEQSEATKEKTNFTEKPFRQQKMFFLGLFGLFCYNAAHSAINGLGLNYILESEPSLSASHASRLLIISHALHAGARIAGAIALYFHRVKPRLILLSCAVLEVAVVASMIGVSGKAAIAMFSLEQ